MTPEQTARIAELDQLLASPNHIHDILRAKWEAERYRITANSVGQQGNYLAYASARDQQKADGLNKAIREIDVELGTLDGKKGVGARADVLRGDRQRFKDELATLAGAPRAVDIPKLSLDFETPGSGSQGSAPEGFDFAVPEKYNQPYAFVPPVKPPFTQPKPVEAVDPFDAPKTEGDDLESLESLQIPERVAPADQEPAVESEPPASDNPSTPASPDDGIPF